MKCGGRSSQRCLDDKDCGLSNRGHWASCSTVAEKPSEKRKARKNKGKKEEEEGLRFLISVFPILGGLIGAQDFIGQKKKEKENHLLYDYGREALSLSHSEFFSTFLKCYQTKVSLRYKSNMVANSFFFSLCPIAVLQWKKN